MKKLILFWKKDIINKLIVLISMILAASIFAFILMLGNMPYGKSWRNAVSEIFPQFPNAVSSLLTVTPEVTPTAWHFDIGSTATEVIENIPSTPAPELLIPSVTPEQISTLLPSSTPSAVVSLNGDCVPKNSPQIGKVLSVLDGNTARIMMNDGLTYTVRYIGVKAPDDPAYSEAARLQNANLVFGREVTLIVDQSDKDDRGRLLRYVMVGDTFVNLTLIQKGLGTALDTPPDSACYPTLKQAEQAAINAQIGIFKATPTP